jgi:hypothetical protein
MDIEFYTTSSSSRYERHINKRGNNNSSLKKNYSKHVTPLQLYWKKQTKKVICQMRDLKYFNS